MSSRPVLILAEQCLEGAMFGGVVGGSVLPAVPDDVEPGAGEDADRVGVVVAAGDRAAIEVSGTGVGVSAVAGEVGDSVAELFVCGPTESDVFDFTGLASGGGDSGQACQRFRGGEPGAAVPNLGEQTGRAGARARQRGEDLRVRVAGELFGDIGVESLDLGVNATSGASATHPRSPTKGWCTSERG
jgi:hypothetical protein